MTKNKQSQNPWSCLKALGVFLVVAGGLCGCMFHQATNGQGEGFFLVVVAIGVLSTVIWAWLTRPVDPEPSQRHDTSRVETTTATTRSAFGRRWPETGQGPSISPPSYVMPPDDVGYGTERAEGYQEGFDEGMTYGYTFGSEEEYDDYTPEGAEWRDPDDDPTAR